MLYMKTCCSHHYAQLLMSLFPVLLRIATFWHHQTSKDPRARMVIKVVAAAAEDDVKKVMNCNCCYLIMNTCDGRHQC
jgi:hypothetical protein